MSPHKDRPAPVHALPLLLAAVLVGACGGSGGGQASANPSGMMNRTFAGQNKCNAKNHNRPFIIEWDATDMSSFQARTANDIVFVKYQGCDLEVLEGCVDDSVKGAFGSYKPVDWTSGSVETIDIADENELYAKLPLGAASLGGRVNSGEKFHMEYYVSGTRSATRDHVYATELAKNPNCATATHYVYAYNLGAFGLASASNLKGQVGGSYFGFGAGGSHTSASKADKKGGELASCTGQSAHEVETCKVPIRLTLREIASGDNPDVSAATAPDTPDSLSLAGKLQATTQREKDAASHLDAARQKLVAKDGKSCLAELDQHDKLDPRPAGLSTNPQAAYPAMTRAQCLMVAGQCDAGKMLLRKEWQASTNQAADATDRYVESVAGLNCQGSMSSRDQLVKARIELQSISYPGGGKADVATCMKDYQTIVRLKDTVKPNPDDVILNDLGGILVNVVPACFARAGDCDNAFKVYSQWHPADMRARGMPEAIASRSVTRADMAASVPACKDK